MGDARYFHNLREGGILRELAPGITARIFPGVNAMLSVVTIEPHAVSPVHSRTGSGGTPPNVPDGGRALDTRCMVLDIFAAPGEEYRQAGQGLGAVTPSD